MLPLLVLALALVPCTLAAPQPAPADVIHVPIHRRHATPEQRAANFPNMMDAVRHRYGYQTVTRRKKRSTTSSPLTDEQNDSSYSAVVDFGTPAQQFNLVLDTGSSDLWVVTDQCDDCTFSQDPPFEPSQSSTYKNESSSLQIAYGSGQVQGFVSDDNVGFAGFNISKQEFLAVTDISPDLLSPTLSGIMGLGFESISALNTTPFWEALFNSNQLSSPVFSFYLERYVNDPQQINTAPGGTFTLGGTNSSLYQGQIQFIDMPSGSSPSYWLQQVQSITVQGKTISVPSSQGLAAIDTGTTLIGAPSEIAKEIWSNVPGSVALSGNDNQGQYAFPCSTSVSVSISFGGTNWEISAEDMNIGSISVTGSDNMCAGGIFDVGDSVGSGQDLPAWIVGDTFLKNVYSVFQADPPAVGFAQLANGLSNTTETSGSGSSSSSGTASPRHVFSLSTGLVTSILTGLFFVL